ncbi:hypothetical protein A9Q84_18110 [Halobacteriovorax marinus]|uniref:Aldehyde dehydrogenase domain-containing protein n=1 Tax=Halobacteriovorax marinus TaxID=97084 RepID=A0A1Y5F8V8_9BACT|nr:hypothetical protein A9Q84_18110 [Halobacteriovorax marinus]
MSDKLKCLNARTGEVMEELTVTSTSEIHTIVEKSHVAQGKWSQLTIDERCDFIRRAYKLISADLDGFAKLIHEEMGKTMPEAIGEIKAYANGLENMIGEVKAALVPEVNSVGEMETTTYFDALGVCASITPWNFPMGMPHTLMMPSLMAGNTIVFKPSEEVTLIGIAYAKYLNEFLPKDVLQVVVGAGVQGKALVESNVQLITFTGSQRTGKSILETGAKDLKRVILELGGKDALIIMDDVDLDAASKFATNNSFRNCGQVCVSTEKILVTEKNHDNLVEKLIERAKTLEVSSLINKTQKSHVLAQIEDAMKKGATMLLGDPSKDESNFLSPVVLTNVSNDMDIMINETFGPVACVTKVKDLDHAVALANEGEYALGSVIFGNDKELAKQTARRLKAGMVGINKSCGGVKGSPWIGAGQSGYNFHGSVAGHRMFTQVRIVTA